MKNIKNINGFTLIEMLVCIAIVAALSVTIGLSVSEMMQKSENSLNASTYEEIFNAALVYSNLSNVTGENCQSLKSCTDNCKITLKCLISNGLLDKNILNEKNPLYEDQKFKNEDEIIIGYELSSEDSNIKEKYVYYTCNKSPSETVIISSRKDDEDNYYEKIEEWSVCS